MDADVIEDIVAVTQDPMLLFTLKNRTHPDVIKAAIMKKPFVLQSLKPEDGLTHELLMDLMNKNGTWLKFVDNQYVTLDLCLVALRQTPNALKFVPSKIKTEHLFYETALEANPALIKVIPIATLTETMARIAYTKNPNIKYLPWVTQTLEYLLPDYGPDGDPDDTPQLNRGISSTHTDQGNQGVCGRHAFSRVIIKNFFELILPLKSSPDVEHYCNPFLVTHEITTNEDYLSMLTPENCSYSGFIKILLFLHCFFLFQTYIPTVEERPEGWLECVQVSALYDHLYTSIEIPNLTEYQHYSLKDALHTSKRAQKKYKISLVTFHFKDITMDNILKITSRGLYLMLRIEASTHESETHAAHFVIIVGAIDGYMFIKNSWDDDTIYKIKFGSPFYLSEYTYDVLTDCSFVIPVKQLMNEEFEDLSRVDSYLHKYDELKTDFNRITINFINNSCPSRDSEPENCDDFDNQEKKFHPRNNHTCKKDATAKFEKLMTLCKSPRLRPRLLLGRGRKRSKRTKRPL
jgi:hypothetical protein